MHPTRLDAMRLNSMFDDQKKEKMMKELYVRFMASVMPVTIDHLMKIVDETLHEKYERLHLLLSSPGGSVFHGLSVYNFLKGVNLLT